MVISLVRSDTQLGGANADQTHAVGAKPVLGNLLTLVHGTLGNTIDAVPDNGSGNWLEMISVASGIDISALYAKLAAAADVSSLTSIGPIDDNPNTNNASYYIEWAPGTGMQWKTTPKDKTATTAQTGSNVTTLSAGTTATLAQAEELAIAVVIVRDDGGRSGQSFDNGFTLLGFQSGGSAGQRVTIIVGYKIVAATTAVTTTATWTGAGKACGLIVTFMNEAVSGGTTYTISPSGSTTPTGALRRDTSKAITGSTTPTGLLAKLASKLWVGSITPTGALRRQTNKVYSGTSTPTGALRRTLSKVFSGSTTPTGSLSSAFLRLITLTGSTTPTGALRRTTSKGLTGTTTPTGVLSRTLNKALSGATTPIGVLSRLTSKRFAGSTTPTGAFSSLVVHLISILLQGSTTPTGALTRLTSKRFTGSTTPTGSLATFVSHLLSILLQGSTTPTGALVKVTNKAFSGATEPTGTLYKLFSKRFVGSTTPIGSLVTSLGGAILHFVRRITGTLDGDLHEGPTSLDGNHDNIESIDS